MVTISCKECGKDFDVYPSRVKRTSFCSKACQNLWQGKNVKGENHPMYGRKHSQESMKKIVAANKTTGADHRGKRSVFWQGGKYKDVRGYMYVSLDILNEEDRLLAQPMARASGKKFVPEHRLVMAKAAGRVLTSKDIVHHLNGIKGDNRIENLRLMDKKAHKEAHWKVEIEVKALRADPDLICYCAVKAIKDE